ncbi:MAG: hypothetical protein HXY26_08250 [Hydrogenophilaceae bacterium]|nr:hypothetical protein [Hydrogenophilaceae bacterium]
MAKAARSSLLASLLVLAGMAGCAQPPRELPPDMSAKPVGERLLAEDKQSKEYVLPCNELRRELDVTNHQVSELDQRLRAAQSDNQGKAIAGILIFTPLMLTMDQQEATKKHLVELETRKDRLLRISQARNCQG